MATRNPNLNNIAALKLAAAAAVAAADSGDAELRGPRGEWWWTGRKPWQCPGYDEKAGVLRALPQPSTATSSRQQVLDYFDNCWALTEVLFSCLQGGDAFVRQPYHQLRHPMMFYYAHTAVVYVNKFRVAGLLQDGIDPFIEQLFEVGVDEMSWDDLSQAKEDWPPVREAWAYRGKAYKAARFNEADAQGGGLRLKRPG
ncbi:hypothetical protein MNEG_7774 [Monoraphidium neglectum]|uniref:Uncharacterized protein n=1 Tax=Monoraphidium neglectum TaxID=145388 RepID=A0A0D2N1T7_9CHLO|nr:hypothetical protein MNEG_7774 [Monoraphidium neglectum]KIZ00191.1 hypothetical protein MNEG_7774 [Monoraphidium neglectum]|eukprot:XP_013899210.1 hypothetical protein MNEG_7774 [Monoraphidium neglectum]